MNMPHDEQSSHTQGSRHFERISENHITMAKADWLSGSQNRMEPQSLAAGQGWEWIKQGFSLFKKAPLLWIVLLMIFLAAAVAVSNIPVVGEPLVSLLMPVISVGLMTCCRSLENNEELEF